MTINQLHAQEQAREAGAVSSVRALRQAQLFFDSDPLRWQIPLEEIPEEVSDRPGDGHYVQNPGPAILLSMKVEEKKAKPAWEMWTLMQRAHDCWVRDEDPRALRLSWVEGIDPEDPNRRDWAHEEEGFLPLEALNTKWLGPAVATYTSNQWDHLVVVWQKMSALAQEVMNFLMTKRELTLPERHFAWWIETVLQIMIDRKMPREFNPPK